jgi:membrane protease YdiL (CAAX protease family)
MTREGVRPLEIGLLLFLTCFCIQVLAQLLLALLIDQEIPGNTVIIVAGGQLAACCTGVLLLAKLYGRQGPAEAGLELGGAPGGSLKAVAAYAAFIPVYIFAVCPVNSWITGDRLQEIVEEYQNNPELASSALYLLLTCALIPVMEEFLFRGVLYGGLRARFPAWAAILVSGVIFGLLHDWAAVLPITALGFLLGFIREWTRSLVPVMIVHALHNSWTLLLIPAQT